MACAGSAIFYDTHVQHSRTRISQLYHRCVRPRRPQLTSLATSGANSEKHPRHVAGMPQAREPVRHSAQSSERPPRAQTHPAYQREATLTSPSCPHALGANVKHGQPFDEQCATGAEDSFGGSRPPAAATTTMLQHFRTLPARTDGWGQHLSASLRPIGGGCGCGRVIGCSLRMPCSLSARSPSLPSARRREHEVRVGSQGFVTCTSQCRRLSQSA